MWMAGQSMLNMHKRPKTFRFRIMRLIMCLGLIIIPTSSFASTADLAAALDVMAKGDLYKGVKLLGPIARKGNPEAQYLLGRAYSHGEGVDPDPAQAVKWLERAADQMHYAAANTLGKIYASGMGVEINAELAAKWFERAADIAEKSDEEHEDCD